MEIFKKLREHLISMLEVVAAIMINEKKEVFIAQRNKPEKIAKKWEFPGGKIEEGENPKESLKREIREEFGIKIKVKDFFMENIYKYEHKKVRLLSYITKHISNKIEVREHNKAEWVDIKNLSSYEFVPADREIVENLKKKKDNIDQLF